MRTSIDSVHPGIAIVPRAIANYAGWLVKAADGKEATSLADIDADLVSCLERAHEMDR